MSKDKIKLGTLGETKTISYLKSKGFIIHETNYRTRFCEIDIIAEDENTLCFIEVKTRRSLKKGLPKESVNHTKQKKIIQGAQFYLKAKNQHNIKLRFDVVEVYIENDNARINLIKNAFWTS